jgi:SAM-dependent methyltransferase
MSLLTRLHNLSVISRDPIYKWRLDRAECPLCGPSLFLVLSPYPVQIRCLRCKETVINLATVAVVKQLPVGSAYELSTYGATFEYARKHFHPFQCSEYLPGAKPGTVVNGVRNEDVQQLSFPDDSFDLITSNQVFEHVPDYLRAFKECLRCLKPDGSLVFTVPMHYAPKIQQNAKLENGKMVWIGVPEYHGSRIAGPNSAPVFWRFSVHDIVSNVLAVGFRSAELIPVFLSSHQKHPQHVIRALK